jgi:hypothetical protein
VNKNRPECTKTWHARIGFNFNNGTGSTHFNADTSTSSVSHFDYDVDTYERYNHKFRLEYWTTLSGTSKDSIILDSYHFTRQ